MCCQLVWQPVEVVAGAITLAAVAATSLPLSLKEPKLIVDAECVMPLDSARPQAHVLIACLPCPIQAACLGVGPLCALGGFNVLLIIPCSKACQPPASPGVGCCRCSSD